MTINQNILDTVLSHKAKVVVVTKYLDATETKDTITLLKSNKVVLGFGENRIQSVIEKKIDRKDVHFIGNIQSRVIKDIVTHCGTIHSLDSIKHAEKIEYYVRQCPTDIFIQVNISQELQKSGVPLDKVESFLEKIRRNAPQVFDCIVGISALGSNETTEAQKRTEYKALLQIRDKFLPGKIVSAGTSHDYLIALQEGVDLVRIGKAFWE